MMYSVKVPAYTVRGKLGIDPRELAREVLQWLSVRGYVVCIDRHGERRIVRVGDIVAEESRIWVKLLDENEGRQCMFVELVLTDMLGDVTLKNPSASDLDNEHNKRACEKACK